jgi:hypothetical protein
MMALAIVPRIIEAKWADSAAAAPTATNSAPAPVQGQSRKQEITSGISIRNDTSKPVREMKQKPYDGGPEREANANPRIAHFHRDAPDRVVQTTVTGNELAAANMPAVDMNFDGIPFPGVSCNCAPPDTNGEVGDTQYVQMVNKGFQVFDKTTGASLLGPSNIATVWTGFGGVCEFNTRGDPVVLYDQLADRWLSRSLPAFPFRPMSASRFRRPTTPRARITVTISTSVPTSSTIRI